MSVSAHVVVQRGSLTVDVQLEVGDGEVLAVSLATLLLLRDRWLGRAVP